MSNGFNIRNQNYFSFSDLTSNLKLIDLIAFGYQPNKTNSGAHSIAIGTSTGLFNQGTFGLAIGFQAAQSDQGSNAIALGTASARSDQGSNAIAIGENAGQNQQKPFGIALGTAAGQDNQGTSSIAIGSGAGYSNQAANAVAIGNAAGQNNQAINAVAIGNVAGQNNQGSFAIAIGAQAGQTNQNANSIILNASGNTLNSSSSGLFVHPIRSEKSNKLLTYNTNTFEIGKKTSFFQTGVFKYSIRNTDHGAWMICNGRALNVNNYPELFALIGYSFGGTGNTFNIPDSRNKVAGVLGQGIGLTNRTLGQNVGSETYTLNTSEIPNHGHLMTDLGHSHTYQTPNSNDELVTWGGLGIPQVSANDARVTDTTTSSTTGITIGNTGGGLAHNIMQPTLFIGNLFILVDY